MMQVQRRHLGQFLVKTFYPWDLVLRSCSSWVYSTHDRGNRCRSVSRRGLCHHILYSVCGEFAGYTRSFALRLSSL